LGSFVSSYVADKQTELNILPTPTDRVGVGNNGENQTVQDFVSRLQDNGMKQALLF